MTVIAAALALAGAGTAADKVEFGSDVYPVLRDNCLSCHAAPYVDAASGRTKQPKGGLRLDTYEWIMKGYEGDEGESVAVVVPGKPSQSTLYTSTALDPDHDDIMPAKGDPLTPAQQAILKQWVAEGAKSNGFKAPAYVNPKAKK